MQDPAVRCLATSGGPYRRQASVSAFSQVACRRPSSSKGLRRCAASSLGLLGGRQRERGEGLSASHSFHATGCEAQEVECCDGGQCTIPPSAVLRRAEGPIAGKRACPR